MPQEKDQLDSQGQDPSCQFKRTILDTLSFFQLYLITAFSWSDFQRTHGQDFTVRLPQYWMQQLKAGTKGPERECSIRQTHPTKLWCSSEAQTGYSLVLSSFIDQTNYILSPGKEKQTSQRHLRWKCNLPMLSKRRSLLTPKPLQFTPSWTGSWCLLSSSSPGDKAQRNWVTNKGMKVIHSGE